MNSSELAPAAGVRATCGLPPLDAGGEQMCADERRGRSRDDGDCFGSQVTEPGPRVCSGPLGTMRCSSGICVFIHTLKLQLREYITMPRKGQDRRILISFTDTVLPETRQVIKHETSQSSCHM